MSSVHGMPDNQHKPDELSPAPNREQQGVYRSMIGNNLKRNLVLVLKLVPESPSLFKIIVCE